MLCAFFPLHSSDYSIGEFQNRTQHQTLQMQKVDWIFFFIFFYIFFLGFAENVERLIAFVTFFK